MSAAILAVAMCLVIFLFFYWQWTAPNRIASEFARAREILERREPKWTREDWVALHDVHRLMLDSKVTPWRFMKEYERTECEVWLVNNRGKLLSSLVPPHFPS